MARTGDLSPPSTEVLPAILGPWSGAGGGKWAFVLCVLAALVLHGLVLGLFAQRSGAVSSGARTPPGTLQVRAIPASVQSQIAVVGAVPVSLPDALNHRQAAQDSVSAGMVQQDASNAAPATDAALQPKSAQERYGQFDYMPREFLSLAPKPLTNIEIPFPESVSGEFNIKVQLSLFIDESGQVQRVRVEGPALPPLLEEAAVKVFRQARFSPGQVGTQVVRSLIRIEVSFESQPVKPPRTP